MAVGAVAITENDSGNEKNLLIGIVVSTVPGAKRKD